MLVGSLVVAPHSGEPLGQAMLGDAISDLAAGFLRAVDIDGLAERDGREHRRDRRRRGLDGIVLLRRLT